MRRASLTTAVVAILVLFAPASVVDAAPAILKAKIKLSKKGDVTATLSGEFTLRDWVPQDTVTITLGSRKRAVPLGAFSTNKKKSKYRYKGSSSDFLRKANFNLKSGKFQIVCRNLFQGDYQNPLKLVLDSGSPYEFELPIDTARRKSKYKGRLTGTFLVQEIGNGTLGSEVRSITAGPIRIDAPDGALLSSIDVEVKTAEIPEELPQSFSPAVGAFDVHLDAKIDNPLEEPLIIVLELGDSIRDEGTVPMVLHYDEDRGEYEPLTTVEVDREKGTIAVESRSFSILIPVLVQSLLLPDTNVVEGFDPDRNGWSVSNPGDPYFTSGGNCLGMSAYSVWFFGAHHGEQLFTKYTSDVAQITATRAHLAQSQFWARLQVLLQSISEFSLARDRLTATQLKATLVTWNKPVVMAMHGKTPNGDGAGHAVVVFGFNRNGFRFYDVNCPGDEQLLPFSMLSGFATYDSCSGSTIYDSFHYLSLPSLGRYKDFEGLYVDAENGFRSSAIHITSPADGAILTTRLTTVTGTVTEAHWDRVTLFVRGERFDDTIEDGAFEIVVPIVNGDNPITVLAGTSSGNTSMWAPESGTGHVDVTANISSSLLVTLTWKEDDVDVDLYVHEPDEEVCWYDDQNQDGVLDVDDTDGYGPENYSVSVAENGTYRIRVHYYSDDELEIGTNCKVSIMLNEGSGNEVRQTRYLYIPTSNDDNDEPGSTGEDWIDVAEVDPKSGTIIWLL